MELPISKRKRASLDAVDVAPVKRLHIIIPGDNDDAAETTSPSLFTPDSDSSIEEVQLPTATRAAPAIPGLFLPTARVPISLARRVFEECMQRYFFKAGVDQVMLFTRADNPHSSSSSLPSVLIELLDTVRELLRAQIPTETHALLFPSKAESRAARQAIINLYKPGQGITSHVDLLTRFGDGIFGISLGPGNTEKAEDKEEEGSCVMRFSPATSETESDSYNLFLPARSLIVLSRDVRYQWTHGIDSLLGDWVECRDNEHKAQYVPRGIRISITFRWLLPGAEIVGS